MLCSLWGPAAHFGALPQNSWVTLESEVWEEDACPNPVSKSSRVLVLAWKGCVGQTVLASCFVPFFCSRIWGFYCAQGHLYSSLVIQGAGEGPVLPYSQRPMAYLVRHSKRVSFIPSWDQCQLSTARAAGTCVGTFGIQVFILIVWLCLGLCLL